MGDDAGIKQRRRFERILVHEISAHQQSLLLCEPRMRGEGLFHLISARLEYLKHIAVATLEILNDFSKFFGGGIGIERQDTIDNMIRPLLVGGVQISGFGRRFKGADDHSDRIRAQVQSLPNQKGDSDKMSLELKCREV